MNIDFFTTGLEVISSYVEDDKELNVLVSTKVTLGGKARRSRTALDDYVDPETCNLTIKGNP